MSCEPLVQSCPVTRHHATSASVPVPPALSDLISSYLGRVDGGWQCIECGRQDSKGHLVEHVEVHHLQGVEYFCSHCNVKKHSRASLRRHVNYAHKKPTS